MAMQIQHTAVIYRELLACFSQPGSIRNISAAAATLDIVTAEQRAALSLAMTLLDAEVSHCFDRRGTLADVVKRMTLSRRAAPEEADYIFIQAQDGLADASEWIRRAKPGTLLHPETGATLFIEAGELAEQPVQDADLLLEGPGIREIAGCRIGGVSPAWIDERMRKNEEYPLGVDLVFYTAGGDILALPRTTAVKEGASRWDTYR